MCRLCLSQGYHVSASSGEIAGGSACLVPPWLSAVWGAGARGGAAPAEGPLMDVVHPAPPFFLDTGGNPDD